MSTDVGSSSFSNALQVPSRHSNKSLHFFVTIFFVTIVFVNSVSMLLERISFRQRPYCDEYTRSHPNSEVKHRKARSVLGWGTAWEALRVPLAFCFDASMRNESRNQRFQRRILIAFNTKTLHKKKTRNFAFLFFLLYLLLPKRVCHTQQ